MDVRETLVPLRLLDPAQFALLHGGDDLGGGVRIVGRRGQLGQRAVHDCGQQFVTQAMRARRAPLLLNPIEVRLAVPLGAMLMQAAVGAVDWVVAAHRVAVGMLATVGAHNTPPTGGVATLQQIATGRGPRQHVVSTVVGKAYGAHGRGVGGVWGHAQGGADGVKGELS